MFEFISDDTAYFNTLYPREIKGAEEGIMYNLKVSFYTEGKDFFCYSTFNDFLSEMQISEVICISLDNSERYEMYSSSWDENWQNKRRKEILKKVRK